MFADLHVHTTSSYGDTTPSQVAEVANQKGLSAVSITDHDRINSLFDGQRVIHSDGVELISGIELCVEVEAIGESVDLLGYGVMPSDELQEMTEWISENRVYRAKEMIRKIESELDIKLDIKLHDSIGRPHIARAVSEHPSVDISYEEVFAVYIGEGCPCYVGRCKPTFSKGISILRDDCVTVGLAHPFRYDDPIQCGAYMIDKVDFFELQYPYGGTLNEKTDTLRRLLGIEGCHSGGSDAYTTDDIGQCGLTESEYMEFMQETGLVDYSTGSVISEQAV